MQQFDKKMRKSKLCECRNSKVRKIRDGNNVQRGVDESKMIKNGMGEFEMMMTKTEKAQNHEKRANTDEFRITSLMQDLLIYKQTKGCSYLHSHPFHNPKCIRSITFLNYSVYSVSRPKLMK